jgi:hypothetical protein
LVKTEIIFYRFHNVIQDSEAVDVLTEDSDTYPGTPVVIAENSLFENDEGNDNLTDV